MDEVVRWQQLREEWLAAKQHWKAMQENLNAAYEARDRAQKLMYDAERALAIAIHEWQYGPELQESRDCP
jgi:hypothetical protein